MYVPYLCEATFYSHCSDKKVEDQKGKTNLPQVMGLVSGGAEGCKPWSLVTEALGPFGGWLPLSLWGPPPGTSMPPGVVDWITAFLYYCPHCPYCSCSPSAAPCPTQDAAIHAQM